MKFSRITQKEAAMMAESLGVMASTASVKKIYNHAINNCNKHKQLKKECKKSHLRSNQFPQYGNVSDWEIAMKKRFESTKTYNIDEEIKRLYGEVTDVQSRNDQEIKKLHKKISECKPNPAIKNDTEVLMSAKAWVDMRDRLDKLEKRQMDLDRNISSQLNEFKRNQIQNLNSIQEREGKRVDGIVIQFTERIGTLDALEKSCIKDNAQIILTDTTGVVSPVKINKIIG
jgi:hypothetical protein